MLYELRILRKRKFKEIREEFYKESKRYERSWKEDGLVPKRDKEKSRTSLSL